jgi:hypothetical protein
VGKGAAKRNQELASSSPQVWTLAAGRVQQQVVVGLAVHPLASHDQARGELLAGVYPPPHQPVAVRHRSTCTVRAVIIATRPPGIPEPGGNVTARGTDLRQELKRARRGSSLGEL